MKIIANIYIQADKNTLGVYHAKCGKQKLTIVLPTGQTGVTTDELRHHFNQYRKRNQVSLTAENSIIVLGPPKESEIPQAPAFELTVQ